MVCSISPNTMLALGELKPFPLSVNKSFPPNVKQFNI